MQDDGRLTWTVNETASLLGLSRASCYEAVRRGEISSLRIGRRYLIPKHSLAKLLGEVASQGAKRGDVSYEDRRILGTP